MLQQQQPLLSLSSMVQNRLYLFFIRLISHNRISGGVHVTAAVPTAGVLTGGEINNQNSDWLCCRCHGRSEQHVRWASFLHLLQWRGVRSWELQLPTANPAITHHPLHLFMQIGKQDQKRGGRITRFQFESSLHMFFASTEELKSTSCSLCTKPRPHLVAQPTACDDYVRCLVSPLIPAASACHVGRIIHETHMGKIFSAFLLVWHCGLKAKFLLRFASKSSAYSSHWGLVPNPRHCTVDVQDRVDCVAAPTASTVKVWFGDEKSCDSDVTVIFRHSSVKLAGWRSKWWVLNIQDQVGQFDMFFFISRKCRKYTFHVNSAELF